eukprot:5624350-Amphidinium_carterae.1
MGREDESSPAEDQSLTNPRDNRNQDSRENKPLKRKTHEYKLDRSTVSMLWLVAGGGSFSSDDDDDGEKM